MKSHRLFSYSNIFIIILSGIVIASTYLFYIFGSNWDSWGTYLSIIALIISVASPLLAHLNYKRLIYNDLPSFNIVQNLWSNKPSYSLVNESSKKLFQPPHPTYFMTIPSKVYWISNDSTVSNLVLTPISYTNVTEQLDTGTSIGEIERSELPINFYGKKGERDLVQSSEIQLNNDLSMKVVTFPFLAIASQINYRYWGEKKDEVEYFITTPTGKTDITSSDIENLKDYLKDNYTLEVHPLGKESIYQTVNNSVFNKCMTLKNSDVPSSLKDDEEIYFLGGKPGGYGFVLKKFNGIISNNSMDPMEK